MRLGFVDHWFVEILGSHNSYIEDGEPPSDVEKMLVDYESKSSDGEDGSLNSSRRTSPVADASAVFSAGHNVASFLPPSSSPSTHSSVLLAPAHCPLNVPLFPESYLMTVARSAAAAVAMTNGNSQVNGQPSPLSLSMKHDRSPDMIVPEIMNGLLPPSVIPGFGFITSSSISPTAGDKGCSPDTPLTDVIDLSTPRIKKEDSPRDLSRISELVYKNSSAVSLDGHDKNNISIPFVNERSKKASNIGLGTSCTQINSILNNIPDSANILPSESPKSAFSSIPTAAQKLLLSTRTSQSLNNRYLKSGFRNLKPFQISHRDSVFYEQSPSWTEREDGVREVKTEDSDRHIMGRGELDKVEQAVLWYIFLLTLPHPHHLVFLVHFAGFWFWYFYAFLYLVVVLVNLWFPGVLFISFYVFDVGALWCILLACGALLNA